MAERCRQHPDKVSRNGMWVRIPPSLPKLQYTHRSLRKQQVSKTSHGHGFDSLTVCNWPVGVTDNMIDFGSIVKGSNPLRATEGKSIAGNRGKFTKSLLKVGECKFGITTED